jgi:hypothetical protein
MWQTGWPPLLIYPNSTYYCNELRRIGLLFTLNAIRFRLWHARGLQSLRAEGLLTEAVLTINALRRTAAHDPKLTPTVGKESLGYSQPEETETDKLSSSR